MTTLALTGSAAWRAYGEIWLTWWLGDEVSALVVSPLLITWSRVSRPDWPRFDWPEFALLTALELICGLIVFGGWLPRRTIHYPLGFLLIPFLLWAASRFRQPGATLSLAQLKPVIEERRAQIDAGDSWPWALGQPVVLQQILRNLLSNALKFVAPGVTPHIRIWCELESGEGKISVQDNGIGIGREHFERIFRVFERLPHPSAYPGTGIGLAIVKRGVEILGGRVGLESSVGLGSRFWFTVKTTE